MREREKVRHAIVTSRKRTSNCERLKATIPSSMAVANIAGIKILYPERIQRPIIISMTPKACKRTRSGRYPCTNGGKYPSHVYGSPVSAENGGYRNASAAPTRSRRYAVRA